MKALADLSHSKLHPSEQDVVRETADALLFCESLEDDPSVEQLLGDFYDLVDGLIESERLLPETAAGLTADVESCGPPAVLAA
jgi:hypothetical protein